MIIRLYLTAAWALALAGCLDGPSLFQQSGDAAGFAVDTTTVGDEAVSGEISGSSQSMQIMESELGELRFPPGSLAIDTNVTVQPGISIANSALTGELGLGDSIESGSLAINVGSSEKVDAAEPFEMSLALSQSGLLLVEKNKVLHIAYRAYRAETDNYVAGIIPNRELSIADGQVSFSTRWFGTYQAVYLEEKVTKAKQVESDTKVVSKAEAKELPDFKIKSVSATLRSNGKIEFKYAGNDEFKCVLLVDDNRAAPFLKTIDVGTKKAHVVTPPSGRAKLYGQFTCGDKYGRELSSGWSDALALTPGAFSITAPGSSITTNTVTVAWGASARAKDYTVVLGTNATCSNSLDTQTTTNTSATFNITHDGTYYVCVEAKNTGGSRKASNNGRVFSADVLGPIAGLTVASAPSNATLGQAIPSFSITILRDDNSTEIDWTQTGKLEMMAWNDCANASVATGTLSSASNLNAVSPTAGVWTFSDVEYSRTGSNLYMRFITGSYRVCFGPLTIKLDACDTGFDASLIEDTIGAANYPNIAACRHNASARDVPFSNVDLICATGWHACYPSEYDKMAREMWTDSSVISFTSNSSSWLNTEGNINEGDGTDVFANQHTGDACAAQSANCYMRGQGPGSSPTSTGKKWTSYADSITCNNDSTAAGITDPNGYRPNGYRSIAFLCGDSDGVICCRNNHTYFNCHTWDADQTSCGIYSDACSWNSGNGTCNPL